MAELTPEVEAAWEDRDGPVVLATVDAERVPNIIYASCVAAFKGNQLVVADNHFNKTRHNLVNGTEGAILFRNKAGKAFQVKGKMAYHKEGAAFDHMKGWNPPSHAGHAAAVLSVEEVYSGAERLI